jgi:beta-glucosidase
MRQNVIESLLSEMHLEEKVSLLAGADLWHTKSIPRVGIPSIKMTDGPIGARGAQGFSSPPAVCFPAPVAMAATWNRELIERVGRALAGEAKFKGAHILLAPMVNIPRSPLAGRNFECFSEDPFLTSCMAVAYIHGLQSEGIGACIKHFVCNEVEFNRYASSSEVDERTLREIYLLPFETAIREVQPWAVMSAYNKLNGVWCSENKRLLVDILKKEWGFDGIVISDWGGTYGFGVMDGGLDLEMPGSGRWMGQNLLEEIERGEVNEEQIDDKVRRILNTINKTGAFEHADRQPERSYDEPENRQLALEVAEESIVLLKNDGILPVNTEQIISIAVIGENARWAQIMGGGSSAVYPHEVVSPLKGIQERVGDQCDVHYAIGSVVHRSLPLLDVNWLREAENGQRGFETQLYDNSNLSGIPIVNTLIDRSQITWSDELLKDCNPFGFSARLTSVFTPPVTGNYQFSLTGNGLYSLSIDQKTIIDNWAGRNFIDQNPWAGKEQIGEIYLHKDNAYELEVNYAWEGDQLWRMLRIGCWQPASRDLIGEALHLASENEFVLLFAGLTNEWESEGHDREDMKLPGGQDELIRKVVSINPNTIVIINSGSPVEMPWIDRVPAVLQSWYGGQEAGRAIARIVFGDVNPSGKLPVTFPRRLCDNPAFLNFPGESGKVIYGERIFVGYRYYDKKEIPPLFPFGHGLSYTSFVYTNLVLDAAEYTAQDQIVVSVEVQNAGSRSGKEIVQLYIRDIDPRLQRPEKELKDFHKVYLEPGETKRVIFSLDQRALAFYDPMQAGWVVEKGAYEVLIGSSSQDIRLTQQFWVV